MKTSNLKKCIVGCIAVISMASCNNSEKGEDKIEEGVQNDVTIVASPDTIGASHMDTLEYITYKEKWETQLRENDNRIADLKQKMKEEKRDVQEKYEKQIDELDTKNNELKTEIYQHKKDDKTTWESFKEGFNKDMNKLGESISSIKLK